MQSKITRGLEGDNEVVIGTVIESPEPDCGERVFKVAARIAVRHVLSLHVLGPGFTSATEGSFLIDHGQPVKFAIMGSLIAVESTLDQRYNDESVFSNQDGMYFKFIGEVEMFLAEALIQVGEMVKECCVETYAGLAVDIADIRGEIDGKIAEVKESVRAADRGMTVDGLLRGEKMLTKHLVEHKLRLEALERPWWQKLLGWGVRGEDEELEMEPGDRIWISPDDVVQVRTPAWETLLRGLRRAQGKPPVNDDVVRVRVTGNGAAVVGPVYLPLKPGGDAACEAIGRHNRSVGEEDRIDIHDAAESGLVRALKDAGYQNTDCCGWVGPDVETVMGEDCLICEKCAGGGDASDA